MISKSTKKSNKGLYFVVLFLLVSILLNIIFVRNMDTQKEIYEADQKLLLKKKNSTISEKDETIVELEEEIANSIPENRDTLSNTKLEVQTQYKQVADEFLKEYLTYNTSTLQERRNNISSITSEDLLNKVAPEVHEEDQNKKALSSDPTFSSSLLDSKIFITDINDKLNTSQVMVEVSYLAKSTEGETTTNAIVYMELQKDVSNKIMVIDYVYYPVNN